MMNAKEAKAMVEANTRKVQEQHQKMVEKFLNEDCENAILEAIGNRAYTAFVEMPEALDEAVEEVSARIAAHGYKYHIRYGAHNAILIIWG